MDKPSIVPGCRMQHSQWERIFERHTDKHLHEPFRMNVKLLALCHSEDALGNQIDALNLGKLGTIEVNSPAS